MIAHTTICPFPKYTCCDVSSTMLRLNPRQEADGVVVDGQGRVAAFWGSFTLQVNSGGHLQNVQAFQGLPADLVKRMSYHVLCITRSQCTLTSFRINKFVNCYHHFLIPRTNCTALPFFSSYFLSNAFRRLLSSIYICTTLGARRRGAVQARRSADFSHSGRRI